MKFKLVYVFLFLIVANKANSNDLYLRDFNNVIKQESSVSNFIYIFDRCAGLFASVGNRFLSSGRADAKKLGDNMMRMGVDFNIASANIAKKGNLPNTVETSMKEAVAIGKIYAGIMDDNHRRTGNALAGQVAKDQNVCIAIYKELKGIK